MVTGKTSVIMNEETFGTKSASKAKAENMFGIVGLDQFLCENGPRPFV